MSHAIEKATEALSKIDGLDVRKRLDVMKSAWLSVDQQLRQWEGKSLSPQGTAQIKAARAALNHQGEVIMNLIKQHGGYAPDVPFGVGAPLTDDSVNAAPPGSFDGLKDEEAKKKIQRSKNVRLF